MLTNLSGGCGVTWAKIVMLTETGKQSFDQRYFDYKIRGIVVKRTVNIDYM